MWSVVNPWQSKQYQVWPLWRPAFLTWIPQLLAWSTISCSSAVKSVLLADFVMLSIFSIVLRWRNWLQIQVVIIYLLLSLLSFKKMRPIFKQHVENDDLRRNREFWISETRRVRGFWQRFAMRSGDAWEPALPSCKFGIFWMNAKECINGHSCFCFCSLASLLWHGCCRLEADQQKVFSKGNFIDYFVIIIKPFRLLLLRIPRVCHKDRQTRDFWLRSLFIYSSTLSSS